MIVKYHDRFEKVLKKRIGVHTKLYRQFKARLAILIDDPKSPVLRDHKLDGAKSGYRAFSVAGDVRVVYKRLDPETIELYDVGSHNQVY